MKGKRILRIFKVLLMVAAAFLLFGLVVSHLWNYVMPPLFGFHMITFWQAVALVLLGKLLFGGFGPRGGGFGWRRRMWERWEQMTPEERDKFRAGMRGSCGSFRDAAPESKA